MPLLPVLPLLPPGTSTWIKSLAALWFKNQQPIQEKATQPGTYLPWRTDIAPPLKKRVS